MPDFTLFFPVLVKSRGSVNIGSGDLNVQDVRAIQKKLEQIEPGLRKFMVREAKAVGAEAQSLVKSAIPLTSPLRASNSQGRLAWDRQMDKSGRIIPANHTLVQFRTSIGSQSRRMGRQVTGLVRLKVDAPMTVIADMAGRSGKAIGRGYKGSGYSRTFLRNGVPTRMRLNGQGEAMIGRLDRAGRPSRFVYPALENGRSRWEAEIRAVVKKYETIANRGFK